MPASDRVIDLWTRLAGMFGADALSRRFGSSPPQAWQDAIDRLNDYQLKRGFAALTASGKASVPSLPEFVKLCRGEPGEPQDIGRPSGADLRAIRRLEALRATDPVAYELQCRVGALNRTLASSPPSSPEHTQALAALRSMGYNSGRWHNPSPADAGA